MKQLKAAGGHIVDVVSEFEHDGVGYYVVHYQIANEPREPFTIRKDNKFYEELPPPPPVTGDVWRFNSGVGSSEYRVLGVDEVNKVYLSVRKDFYDDGDWSVPGRFSDQTEAEINASEIHVRRYPEMLDVTLVSRISE